MINRRAFLASLLGFTVDPERLLWVPGKRLISIPPLAVEMAINYQAAVDSIMSQLAQETLAAFADSLTFARLVNRDYNSRYYQCPDNTTTMS